MTLDITFEGLAAPLRLHEGGAILPVLSQVAGGWRHHVGPADPARRPFFTICATDDPALVACESHVEAKPLRRLDPVNAVCDAMAALALALPAEEGRVICLHAAAVAMAGRLIVFPSVRRAGKSTLSVALALAGHPMFGDDVLPLSFTADGGAIGQAMGLAPRLRLPLPERLPMGFHALAGTGPENRQYRYLPLPDQPERGAALPLGAFVILDRQDGAAPARLERLCPDAAMDVLLHQNFTRDRHSGDILQALATTLPKVAAFRLRYADLEGAIACLEEGLCDGPPPPTKASGPFLPFRLANLACPPPQIPAPGAEFCQRPGTVARDIGTTLYLADAEGRAIHRMDSLAAALWEVMEQPVPVDYLVQVMTEAFPETGHDRIVADLNRLLVRLHGAGLITAA